MEPSFGNPNYVWIVYGNMSKELTELIEKAANTGKHDLHSTNCPIYMLPLVTNTITLSTIKLRKPPFLADLTPDSSLTPENQQP
ncbi:hypothetical protein HOLleu_31421 [Holothuria leucospilota]|uniref:Uncharacterized protein n=1 Tax=Holothuria leucospilota TaxID=206669 RepID=A0A9Q0YQ81_HOLLE|nr:hypothetical protein HOLleu_31421 [Holothuria leucospilota]